MLASGRPAPAGLPLETVASDDGHPCLTYVGHIVDRWDDLAATTFFVRREDLTADLVAGMTAATVASGPLVRVTVEIRITALPPGRIFALVTEALPCPPTALALAWKHLFLSEPPRSVRVPVVPAFAVSREIIFRKSRNFFLKLRRSMEEGDLLPPAVVECLWDYIFRDGADLI